MKTVKSFVVLVLLGLVIGGCMNETIAQSARNDKKTSKTCRVISAKSQSIYDGDTTISTLYEYNEAEKITKSSKYDTRNPRDTHGLIISILYDYSINGIVDEKAFWSGELFDNSIYKLDSNGYASSVIFHRKDTILCEYNADGYLIKRTDKRNNEVTTYTITNGNITRETVKDSSGTTTSTTIHKYTDILDKRGIKNSFTGKGSINLPSKETISPNHGIITTYSYTFDNNGYPLEVVQTDSIGNNSKITKTKYTYTCP